MEYECTISLQIGAEAALSLLQSHREIVKQILKYTFNNNLRKLQSRDGTTFQCKTQTSKKSTVVYLEKKIVLNVYQTIATEIDMEIEVFEKSVELSSEKLVEKFFFFENQLRWSILKRDEHWLIECELEGNGSLPSVNEFITTLVKSKYFIFLRHAFNNNHPMTLKCIVEMDFNSSRNFNYQIIDSRKINYYAPKLDGIKHFGYIQNNRLVVPGLNKSIEYKEELLCNQLAHVQVEVVDGTIFLIDILQVWKM